MSSKLKTFFRSLFNVEREERLKLLLLAIAFFLVIGAYTLVRELKSSMFMSIVGKEYVPWARMAAMIMLVPAALFYSFLVDRMRRHELLYFYSIAYGLMGLLCMWLVGHPTIGLANTETSPFRLFGWFFYFFIEVFSPFVISVFWAFANSVYSPEAAKHNYAFLVSGSKFGGMFTAGVAWVLFNSGGTIWNYALNDVQSHQLIFAFFSLLSLLIPLVIYLLRKKVPHKYLHGYEAVYKFEKAKEKSGEEKISILAGLTLLMKLPYIFGIFGMLFFYEVVSTILSYHRLGVAQECSTGICGVSAYLFKIALIQHFLGIIISFLGTRTLLNFFGEKKCLLLIPAITSVPLLYFIFNYTQFAVIFGIISLQVINYAFAQPVRESLYIPTVKDIKFKSKSWIDSCGSRFGKGVGSTFVVFTEAVGSALFLPLHGIFFGAIVMLWFMTAFLLGNRYNKAVANNEVIGLEKEKIA